MDKITIDKSCKKCSRSSTYVKRKIKGKDFYVCSICGFKLCAANQIMSFAFPTEHKPYSSKARQYGYVNPRKSKKTND